MGFFLVWLAAWSGMSWSWCQLAGGWSHILGQLTDRPRLSGWSWVPTWQAAGSRGPCIWCLPTTNQGQIPGLGLAQWRAKLGPRVSDYKAVGGSQSWWWPTGRQVWVPGPAVEWVCVPAELASCREPSQNCSWQAGGGGGQEQVLWVRSYRKDSKMTLTSPSGLIVDGLKKKNTLLPVSVSPGWAPLAPCLFGRISEISRRVWPRLLSNRCVCLGSRSMWDFVCILLAQSLSQTVWVSWENALLSFKARHSGLFFLLQELQRWRVWYGASTCHSLGTNANAATVIILPLVGSPHGAMDRSCVAFLPFLPCGHFTLISSLYSVVEDLYP